MKKAVVLLSGGLDSSTVLALARAEGYQCHTLSFDYGQRNRAELVASKRLSEELGAVEHKIIQLDLRAIGGSALTDSRIDVPTQESEGVPVTYVPARNTVFLSIALGWAEVLEAYDVFIGVNAVDYSGYPDCRPEFIEAFQTMANLATKASTEGHPLTVHTPLIDLSKSEIIQKGVAAGLDYGLTVSCYDANEAGEACGQCDACRLRRQGFEAAEVADPTRYR
ncbi:exsB protein [gamma proteobacterium HTCC5015]|nr:exsB protein [gamma proteobacterium HTCC5015]